MVSDHNKEVGRRVKELYKAHGMTQAQLAEALGYSDPNTISMIVNGHRALTPEKAMILIALFPEVSLDWMMGRSDYKNKGEQQLYEWAASVVDRKKLDEALQSFLYGTQYYLLTPEEIRKHGEGIQSPPLLDYVLFKGDEKIVLSEAEIECFSNLIKNQITSQIDYLFQQKEAIRQNEAFKKSPEYIEMKKRLKQLEELSSGECT